MHFTKELEKCSTSLKKKKLTYGNENIRMKPVAIIKFVKSTTKIGISEGPFRVRMRLFSEFNHGFNA